MKDIQPSSLSHPAETLIAAYAIGRCSPEEQAEIDEHCFTCEKCRTRLSILLRVCAADGSAEEQRQLERLFPLGIETIAQVRLDGGLINSLSVAKDRKVQSHSSSSPPTSPGRFIDLLRSFFSTRRYQFAAAVLAIISVTGGGYYWWHVRTRSALEDGLAAVNLSYKYSRPLEARITGIDYQPYERKRGDENDPDVNRDQINYALAELTHSVASNPTAETRHALGRLYLMLRKFNNAEEQMKLALESTPNDARLHTDLASLYYERSKYERSSKEESPFFLLTEAVKHYKSALEINPQLAEALFNRALCYEQMKIPQQAIEDWEKYLQLDKTSKWAREAQEHLTKLKGNASQPPESDKGARAAVEKAASLNNEAALRQMINQNYVIVRQFSSNELLDKYLNATLTGDEHSAEAALKAIRLIGRLSSELKKDEYLSDLTDFASRASPEVKKGMQNVRLMLRQADIEFGRSSHDEAFKLYQSAYQAAERIGDQQHVETAALSLFRYYSLRAKTQEISTLGARIAAQSEQRHHRQIQAKTYLALANVYFTSQQIALALENSLRAIEIAKELGDSSTITNGLRAASAAYSRSGDYSKALNKDFELLSSLQNTSNQLAVLTYQQVAETLFRVGDFSMAYDYQREALHLVKSINNPLLLAGSSERLGVTLWKLGKNNDALAYLNEAKSLAEQIPDQTERQLLQIELFTVLGDISLDQGKTNESLEYYNSAIQAIKASPNRVYLSAIHQGLAAAYLAQNKVSQAENQLRISISLAERDRQQIRDAGSRSAFFATRQNVYRAMVDLQFFNKQSPASAFDYAEIAKSRSLLDTLSGKAATSVEDGQVTLRLSGSARPLTIGQIQSSLPQNEQLLSYCLTDKRILIWLITANGVVPASVEYNPEQLKKTISTYLANIRTRQNIAVINQQASDLYQLLIAPVVNRLSPDRLLCIIPDSYLYQLPFDALLSPNSNHYLVEDFSVTTAPSASVLIKTIKIAASKKQAGPESYFGISNPQFSHDQFPTLPKLPSSEDEVTQAQALYQKKESLSGENATEAQVLQKIGNYSIAHIATHILINEQFPLLSTILLAEEKESGAKAKSPRKVKADGTLQAQEIYQLALPRTRLVILSGCRSATGSYAPGESIGALAQSFFAARVPAVVASFWEVDDDTSAEIMYALHYNHRVKRQGFGEALSQAQRSIIHSPEVKKRHPYYWAAFLLSGDGGTNSTDLR